MLNQPLPGSAPFPVGPQLCHKHCAAQGKSASLITDSVFCLCRPMHLVHSTTRTCQERVRLSGPPKQAAPALCGPAAKLVSVQPCGVFLIEQGLRLHGQPWSCMLSTPVSLPSCSAASSKHIAAMHVSSLPPPSSCSCTSVQANRLCCARHTCTLAAFLLEQWCTAQPSSSTALQML
jgi:hypothetical protein